MIEDPFLKHPHYLADQQHLKTSSKEDEDFVILPDSSWIYLYDIYGGIDLPRYSIQLTTDEDEEQQEEGEESSS